MISLLRHSVLFSPTALQITLTLTTTTTTTTTLIRERLIRDPVIRIRSRQIHPAVLNQLFYLNPDGIKTKFPIQSETEFNSIQTEAPVCRTRKSSDDPLSINVQTVRSIRRKENPTRTEFLRYPDPEADPDFLRYLDPDPDFLRYPVLILDLCPVHRRRE